MAINLGTKALALAMLGSTAVQRIYLGPVLVWQNEVVARINAHTAQVVLPGTYFSAADWANPLVRKRLIVDGVHIWSYTDGVPALDLGSGRQGELHVDIKAGSYILGHAGARNGGTGGTAIQIRQNLCWIINAGSLYGGGGGGGVGGQGGNGYWQEAYTYNEGWQYSRNYHGYIQDPHNNYWWAWYAGGNYGNLSGNFDSGGWTYIRGSLAESWTEGRSPRNGYYISRQQTRYNTYYSTGGAGGTGGRGTGYNSSLSNVGEGGFAGASGGANAGTGGTGGAGGGWGGWGGNGSPGNSGNNGAGFSGAAGGPPGFYIAGNGNLNSFSNTGQVLGRQG